MSHVPHELAEEFPDHKQKLHELKMSDAHFVKLSEEYHEINREIHRIEAAGVNTGDEEFEGLKKKRLALKDSIHEILMRS